MPFKGNYYLVLPEDPSKAEASFAVELAGILGFYSLALDFPLVRPEADIPKDGFGIVIHRAAPDWRLEGERRLHLSVPDASMGRRLLKALLRNPARYLPGRLPAAKTPAKAPIVFSSDSILEASRFPVRPLGVDSFLLPGNWLPDEDGDFLPDAIRVGLRLPRAADSDSTCAAADIAAVLGAQSTVYEFPLLGSKRQGTIRFKPGKSPARMSLEGQVLTISGTGMAAFVRKMLAIALPGQRTEEPFSLADWVAHFQNGLAMANPDGQFAYAKAFVPSGTRAYACHFDLQAREQNQKTRLLPQKFLLSHKDEKEVWKKEFDLPWEVERLTEALRREVLPKLHRGDRVEVFASLSEDEAQRRETARDLRRMLRQAGMKPRVRLISAYKQGFSWVDEEIIPRLNKLPNLAEIEIQFKAFLPPGKTEWPSESGATPSLSSARDEDPSFWFDMPIRLLQELYPIDDVIQAKTKLPREKLRFTLYEGEEDISYRLIARDEKGQRLLQEDLKAYMSERPFLDAFKGLGKVHPGTGHLRVSRDGEVLLDETIPTDLEMIWDAYQAEVLPALQKFIDGKLGRDPLATDQPLFSSLQFTIEASEPDYDLGIRTDRISALDALHEDLYFVTLDYFRTYGLRHGKQNLNAPGLILPIIRKGKGKPRFTAQIFDRLDNEPAILVDGQRIRRLAEPDEMQVLASSLADGRNGLSLGLDLRGPEALAKVITSFGRLAKKGALSQNPAALGISQVELRLNGRKLPVWKLPKAPARQKRKPLGISEVDLHSGQVVGYDQYLQTMEQLKAVPGLRVWPVALSYQERRIYATQVLPRRRGWLARSKWLTHQPTLYINGRHHANEVSGTNANFEVLRAVMSDPKNADLPERLNIVFVPFENPDGAALHYRLQQDNPRWKLHVARYNALGLEMAYGYFDDATIHTECLAFTRVWREFLPDIVIDDHGVPDHEWDQQFSGYTSPWFKGFWMPRALLYAYFFHVKDERFAGNLAVNKGMEAVVARSMRGDPEIRALNADWKDRFEKYAHSWMPRLFPADYFQDLISYWVSSPYDPDHRYAAARYPWVTAVSFVSEVSDETAQGKDLELCTKAHALHDLAVIDWLDSARVVHAHERQWGAQKAQLTLRRKRPIYFSTRGSKGGKEQNQE